MELRLGRFIAIAVVVVALGMLTLRHRARQLHQRLPGPETTAGRDTTPPPPLASPTLTRADSDSIAVVAAAVAALQTDDSIHGWGSIPVQVLKFERDSASVLVTLLPQDPTVPGGGALVRVAWVRGTVGTGRLIERYR